MIRRVISALRRRTMAAWRSLVPSPQFADRLYAWWWWRSFNGPHLIDRSYIEALDRLPPDARGLDVGSGGGRIRPNATTTDITPHPEVDVVCDASSLPFDDGAFDYVWSNAVLEHVRDPHQVAREMVRVLKSGGIAIIQTPFLENIHSWPEDYYRFTPQGLRYLFRDLEEVKTGVSAGPGQVLPDLIQYYFAGFPDIESRRLLPTLCCMLIGVWLWPIRLLDHVLKHQPSWWRWARAYYFIGRKP